jgi:signal transduction histidine kinase
VNCPHCGQRIRGGGALEVAPELEALRAYCTRLERVVSNEATSSAVLHDLRSVLMALAVLLERDSTHDHDLAAAARHAAQLARQMATRKASSTDRDARCEPNEVLVRLQHVLGALIPGEWVLQLGANVGAAAMPSLRFQRVVVNLVANAGEAAGHGGTVRVATERRGGKVVLTVSDTGDGIVPGTEALLGKPTFTTKEGGTGMGLALVSRAVEDAGGRIDVDSVAAQGTTVRVELPGAD